MFHFYASDVPWFIKPIFYVIGKSGDENKAIEYASLVSQKGHLAVCEARYMLYELSMRRKDYEHAIDAIQSLAGQYPNNHLYVVRASEILDYTNRYSAVIDIGRKIWDAHHTQHRFQTRNDSTDYACICYCLGKAYSARGRSQEALEVFNEMIRDRMVVTFHDHVFYLLGKNYEKENDRENAMRCYKTVVELGPSSEYGKKAQERLASILKEGK